MSDGTETESHTNIHIFIVKTYSRRYCPVTDSRDRTVEYTFSFFLALIFLYNFICCKKIFKNICYFHL